MSAGLGEEKLTCNMVTTKAPADPREGAPDPGWVLEIIPN